MRRRAMLIGLGATVLLRPARATSEELAAAIRAYTGGIEPQPGRVHIDIAPLVENGNAVPVTVSVDSAMSEAEHVQAIALFNQLNPQRDVARFTLSLAQGRAQVGTRIRLATSQQLVAIARFNDGSFHAQTVEVVVTLAACVE
ncbi:SoxY-related AACIE arm protein [Roseateles violae]|uniref:SoxY-related AACIE arm protein n=1 Tax=Roseateles violae TaxID=3058042 RepID=A0ABT8DTR1_9BURK|nr:SoxY-related AACIE arm protein [Pelomonas sp. PFR6]MDN3920415.1 SoxY-related AACIE arm protein [Pelomonas sp. PFR6]